MNNEVSKWWHPVKSEDGLDFLCDHLGDAKAVMNAMWKRLCELDSELPPEGWETDND